MHKNHLMTPQSKPVSPKDLFLIPNFSTLSVSGIYYQYHKVKRHVGRAKHLKLTIGDLALYLEQPVSEIESVIYPQKMVG